MGKYKKILVAFDGSESGKNALVQAIGLARTEKSWIKVIAVVPAYEGDLELVGVSNIREAISGPGEKLLAQAKEIAAEEGAAIITNLEQGEPYSRIVEVAKSEKCDLIVMGRRGLSHLERALMGSVTARVIGHTHKDVLVIPHDSEIDWSCILLATDGSEHSRAATKRAVDLAKSYGGELHAAAVVNVNDEFYAQAPQAVEKMIEKAKATLADVVQQAKAAGIDAGTTVREGEPYEMITDVAKNEDAGIIVMGSRGMTGLGKILMGSVTEKVIGYSNCPVLVARSR